MFPRPLLHPDPDPNAGTPKKVEVDETELAELRALKTEAETLRTQHKTLAEQIEEAKKGVGGDTAAMTSFLKKLGVSDETISSLTADSSPDPDPSDDEEGESPRRRKPAKAKARREAPPPDDDDDDLLGDPNEERLSQMQEQLTALQRTQAQTFVKDTNALIDNSIKEALDKTPEVGTLLETLRALSDDETVSKEKLREGVFSDFGPDIRQRILTALRNEQARTGKTWDPSWVTTIIPKVAETAAAETAKKLRKLVPDPAKLGKSVNPNPFLDNQGRLPPAPKYAPGKTTEDVKDAIHRYGAAVLLS